MKEMDQIEKYIANVHKKFMNVKTTTDDHMTRDLWFTMNILTLAFNNLHRCLKQLRHHKKHLKI